MHEKPARFKYHDPSKHKYDFISNAIRLDRGKPPAIYEPYIKMGKNPRFYISKY